MGTMSMGPNRKNWREDLASSYSAIIAETFFDRNGPQEDCGWALTAVAEEFEWGRARIRRELLHARAGNAGGFHFPGFLGMREKHMVFDEMQRQREALKREGSVPRPHSHFIFEDRFVRVTFADESTLAQTAVGALGILQGESILLFCLAGLEVEKGVAPNDRHYGQVLNSEHRVCFFRRGVDSAEGEAFLDPRNHRLCEGKPYKKGNLGQFEFLLEPLPWPELQKKLRRE